MTYRFFMTVVSAMVGWAWVTSAQENAPERMLFIGNSYTFYNNLPALLTNMVKSAGEKLPVLVKAHTPGGCTLIKHAKDPKAMALISEGNWDVVVVQGQSQEAALSEVSETTREDFLAGGKELGKRIREKSPKARIILYQTWARHPDAWKDPGKKAGVGSSPKEMQQWNHTWYARLASEMPGGATVAPVGDAWEVCQAKNPELRLHIKDNSHPTFAGSYLAGLMLYRAIYTKKPLSSIRFKGSLTDKDVAALKASAEATAP